MSKEKPNRREFIRRAAATAVASQAALYAPRTVLGANDRINVGVIGCGSRGQSYHIPQLHRFSEQENVVVTAVCDPWRQMHEGAALKAKELFGIETKQFEDYRELIDLEDIDAVTIASCDHQHSTMLGDAVLKGKDVYCEKPMSVNMKELNKVVDIVKASGRIVQIGLQRRSEPWNVGCKKLVQEGAIGDIIKVDLAWNAYKPYWHQYVRPVRESETNWKLFRFNLPDKPFTEDEHCCWYGYRGYTSGPIGGWMSHMIDVAHYITGSGCPSSAVTIGGIDTWKDQRTCPDNVQTVLD